MKNYLRDREIQETLKKIESMENAVNNPHYDLNQHQSYQVQILIDNKLKHGQFKPHATQENTWLATSNTFKAMKKDIFSLDEDAVDLKDEVLCQSCKETLDKQFWNCCPHCLSEFKA